MNEETNDLASGKEVRQAHKAEMMRIADLQPEKAIKKTVKKVAKKVVKKVIKKIKKKK